MNSRSIHHRQLSRSKLDLFLECPSCFYDAVALGIERPGQFPFTLNIAVDALLKREFDAAREAGKPHRLVANSGLDLLPFRHPDIPKWRSARSGLRWTDPQTNWTLIGAIDDLWQASSGSLMVVDYKATARQKEVTLEDVRPSYRRQVEIYQFLVEQQGFTVDPTAWFVYVNGTSAERAFDGILAFRETLLPYAGDWRWVEPTFRRAADVASASVRPDPSSGCAWCEYVRQRSICHAEAAHESVTNPPVINYGDDPYTDA